MYECLSVCISVYHLCWKRVLNSLELDLWVVVSIHVGAGTWSSVSCRSGQCSEPLIHLCSPRNNFQHCKWGKEDSSLFGPLHHAPLMAICGRQRLLFSTPSSAVALSHLPYYFNPRWPCYSWSRWEKLKWRYDFIPSVWGSSQWVSAENNKVFGKTFI